MNIMEFSNPAYRLRFFAVALSNRRLWIPHEAREGNRLARTEIGNRRSQYID